MESIHTVIVNSNKNRIQSIKTNQNPVQSHKSEYSYTHARVQKSYDRNQTKQTYLNHSRMHVQVGEPNKIGTLLMQPEGHKEGLYSCLISRDGRLVLTHVYPLFRQATSTGQWAVQLILNRHH